MRRKLGRNRAAFNERTTMVARHNVVFGWLYQGVIQAIVDTTHGRLRGYDWTGEQVLDLPRERLLGMGLYTRYPPRNPSPSGHHLDSSSSSDGGSPRSALHGPGSPPHRMPSPTSPLDAQFTPRPRRFNQIPVRFRRAQQ